MPPLIKLIASVLVHGALGCFIGAGLGLFILAPVAMQQEFIGRLLGNSNKEIMFTASFYSGLLGLALAALAPILKWRKSIKMQKDA